MANKVILAESGKMLSGKIEEGDFTNFTLVCDCIMQIIDALEPVHNKGFLHLDISPDTIYFSDTGTAQLINNTSIFNINDEPQNRNPSFRTGYSARELNRNINTKPLPLIYATDLYSVTAVFFRLLVGRTPKEGDWSRPGEWQLNNKTGFLKGASSLLVEMTNDFLRKGLSLTATRRFSDVGEMRNRLEDLKRLGGQHENIAGHKKRLLSQVKG
jgi:serine/threonine protein kinase